jgi:general secretion pathway protein F
LMNQSLTPVRISPINGARLSLPSLTASKRRFDLVLFSQELNALLKAGLGLIDAIEALESHDGAPESKQVLSAILAKLRSGENFSSALMKAPQVFPPLYIGLIRSSEGTSGLPSALSRYIDYQTQLNFAKNRVISAMVYPVILLMVGLIVTLFLIMFVVPRFAQIYKGTGRDLPWLSKLLMQWGQVASEHTALVLVVISLMLFASVYALRSVIVSGRFMQWLLSMPILGSHLKLYSLSRLYLTLGMLLRNGMPVPQAIDTAQSVLPDVQRQQLLVARSQIAAGIPLTSAFDRNGLTTPISSRLLRVGEQTGDVGRMFEESANFYDATITRFIERFTRAFEPILMAVIGVIVGTIVIMLYMPIFDLAGSLP